MKRDIEIHGYRPEVTSSRDVKHFIIRCEIIEPHPKGARRSGKHINLGLTQADAMRLLAQLQSAQQHFSLPTPALVKPIDVPPTKDQH